MTPTLKKTSWGYGPNDLPLSQCPIQNPDLFGMDVVANGSPYAHGQTEWYTSREAAQARLNAIPATARWALPGEAFQGDKPIPLGSDNILFKVIFKYSETFWLVQ